MRNIVVFIVLFLICISGCSGVVQDAVTMPSPGVAIASSSHGCWGMWQFTADPAAATLDVVPIRGGEMHVNVLVFLEPPPFLYLTLETLAFNGDTINADIGLRHPFLGLTEFTGFDVAGILISNGSVSGFQNPDLRMASSSDTRLENADGLTRWWNPAEFPQDGTMFGYKDGLLGAPDSTANFNSTLNGYKFFCDALTDPNSEVDVISPTERAMFSAGTKNIRHYTIHLGAEGLVFNYAVDASWTYPDGTPPFTAPDDFPPEANRPEAWNAEVSEISNTLFNDGTSSGGGLSLSIDVWDHYNAGLNTVKVESPGNFTAVISATPTVGGAGYSTYQLDIPSATPAAGSIGILVEVASEALDYGNLLPGETVTAYFNYTASVSTEGFVVTSPNGGEVWTGNTHENITWSAPGSVAFVDIAYSKDNFVADTHVIANGIANSGTHDWTVANDPSTTVKVRVSEYGGSLGDTSDNNFTIVQGGCNFGSTGFALNQTYSNFPNTYTQVGVFVSKKDPVQRLFARNYFNLPIGNNGGTIFVFNASNPLAGAIASYDTGIVFYTNNPEAMWIDSVSEPGVDRIFYQWGNAYSPPPLFHSIDWDGTQFTNPQNMPDAGSYKWRCCLKPNGDIVMMNVSFNVMYFYMYDKSNNYAFSSLFSKDPATVTGMTSGAWVQKMAYDPQNDTILLLYKQQSTSESGKLYALDATTGALEFSDLDVFGSGNNVSISMGLNVDMENPGCHVVAYAGTSNYSGNAWIVRYSGDLSEKATNSYTVVYTDGRGGKKSILFGCFGYASYRNLSPEETSHLDQFSQSNGKPSPLAPLPEGEGNS